MEITSLLGGHRLFDVDTNRPFDEGAKQIQGWKGEYMMDGVRLTDMDGLLRII